jgi:DNA transformation protein
VVKSEGFRAFVEELFEPVDGASVRPMFGGLGIFRERIMFALAADEVLYLRSDSETDPAFLAEGSQPWVYEGRDRAVTMPYWRVPERLLDDHEEFRTWALAAFAAALRAKSGKAKTKPRTKKAPAAAAKPGTRTAKPTATPWATAKPAAAKGKVKQADKPVAKGKARQSAKLGAKPRPGR